MENLQIKKASLFERIALFFVRKKKYYSYDREIGAETMLVYKKMRGVTYIIEFVVFPPKHYNCRCYLEPRGSHETNPFRESNEDM